MTKRLRETRSRREQGEKFERMLLEINKKMVRTSKITDSSASFYVAICFLDHLMESNLAGNSSAFFLRIQVHLKG